MTVQKKGERLFVHAKVQTEQQPKAKHHTLRRVLYAFHPYRGQVILVLLIILITSALELVVPLMMPPVFDDAFAHHNMNHLLIYGLIMIVATLISGGLEVAQAYLNNKVGQHVMRDLRNKLYGHLQSMSLHFFTSVQTGEIQSRLSNDVSSAQSAVTDTFTNALTSIAMTTATIIAMFYLSPLLTLVSFFLLPFFLWITFRVGNVRRQLTGTTQKGVASLNTLMQETLSINGILLIKAFGRKKYAQKQFETDNQKITDMSIKQQMVGQWFFAFMYIFAILNPVIIYIVAGWAVIYHQGIGTITLGELFAFIIIQNRFFGPFSRLLTLQVKVQGSLAVFDRIFDYLDLAIEITDAPEAVLLSPQNVQGNVLFKDVSFTYKPSNFNLLQDPKEKKKVATQEENSSSSEDADVLLKDNIEHLTLKSISFEVKSGQLVALVGPSGAGKTTITYLLPRFYDVDSGAVEIDGLNVKNIALDSLGATIGIVTQEAYLFHASVRQNLLYVCPEATEEEMVEAAKAAAIHDRIMELEDGYDSIVGERGYRFSGGEKQRLAIARVLLKNPRILILDEATSSLDTHSERLIQSALKPLMKSRTTIAIAHRLSTILAADLILVIDKGEIVERGTHQELLTREGLYAMLYRQQFAAEVLV